MDLLQKEKEAGRFQKNQVDPNREFKVLALDGGGIKGIFPAAYLHHIELLTGKKITDYFDLIVGTSTGGIIALGLAMGISTQELLKFYKEKGPEIFPDTNWFTRFVRFFNGLFMVKYTADVLEKALQDVFKDRKLHEACRPVCIPAYDLNTNNQRIFKTPHNDTARKDFRVQAWKIARATSAAPTFFPPFPLNNGLLVDGGVYANNPSMIGVIEAANYFDCDFKQIKMLSIGTSSSEILFQKGPKTDGGGLSWMSGNQLIELFMQGQTNKDNNLAKYLLEEDNFVRIDQKVDAKRFSLDNAKTAKDLEAYAEHQANISFYKVNDIFFKKKAGAFVPIYRCKDNTQDKCKEECTCELF